MDKLNKRIVLVTGATGGLGTAMCKELYNDGFHVVANYRNKQKAEEWQAKMKSEGYDIEMFEGDVNDFDSVGKSGRVEGARQQLNIASITQRRVTLPVFLQNRQRKLRERIVHEIVCAFFRHNLHCSQRAVAIKTLRACDTDRMKIHSVQK